MKKVLFFLTLIISLSFVVPYGTASANSLENKQVTSNVIDSDKKTIVENGSEPFSILKEDSLTDDEISTQGFCLSCIKVDISNKSYGGILGEWSIKAPAIVRRVNIVMTLDYKKNWYDLWDTVDTEVFIYAGGLGYTEDNEKTFYPGKAGKYRVCISGTLETVSGTMNAKGCSDTIDHNGTIIIAGKKEEE